MVICLRCSHAEVETRQTHEMFCFAGLEFLRNVLLSKKMKRYITFPLMVGCGDLPRIYARFIFLCIIEQKGKCVEGRG